MLCEKYWEFTSHDLFDILGKNPNCCCVKWMKVWNWGYTLVENSQSPDATVIPVWKTPVCKQGACKRGILKHPVFNIVNFRGWIWFIFDKITLIHSFKNEFNPTSKVQNIENRVFQNARLFSKWRLQLPLCIVTVKSISSCSDKIICLTSQDRKS